MKIECSARTAAALAVVAPVATVLGLDRYARRHRIDPGEVPGPYPGDELLTGPGTGTSTLGVEIDAPPERVWPLVNQIGQTKAGFYSFSVFERAVHFLIHNTYEPQPRWQHTAVGDWCFFGQQGIGMEIVRHEPGRHLVGLSDSRRPPDQEGAIAWVPAGMDGFAWVWGFFLEPLPGGRTRLLLRTNRWALPAPRGRWKAFLVAKLMWGWSSQVMQTRMLDELRWCAEGRRFLAI